MSDYIKRDDALIECANSTGLTMAHFRLLSIPSADVAPVKHGRWKSGACSKCGSIKPMTKIEYCGLIIWESPYKLNYCPSCGAIMDGESDEWLY